MRLVVAFAAALSLAAPVAARAGDIAFTVINDSSYDLVSFYTAPINASAWGHNLLGTYTLKARTKGTATIAGGAEQCLYDLKYVLSDGETYYKRELDICRISSYRIFD